MNHSRHTRRLRVAVTALGAVALAACGDLLFQPERVAVAVDFEEPVVTVTEGEMVELRPFLVDQAGQPFTGLPRWLDVAWSSSDLDIFDPVRILAGRPGEAAATVLIDGLSGTATVRVNPTALGVAVPHAYLVQSVQRPDGSVPLVAGRDAVLRVFATGDVINFFEPEAEAVFRVGGTEVGRKRFGLADGGSIPGAVDEGEFRNSWAVDVPADWIRPGLSFSVTLDPDRRVPITDRSAARFPASGTVAADVREVPDMELRFVPIRQTHFGSTGSISSATAPAWTEFLEDVFPIAGIDRDVRGTFHTDAVTEAGETDWMTIIQEIWALRLMDDDDRYYYGVLRRHGGWAGLGYVGWPVAIGLDEMGTTANDPIPVAYTVFAHELGHNFGRWHAPACGAGNPDPDFPHPGGAIGYYGLHDATRHIRFPQEPDLMGYCWPHWVSDYTFEGVLRFRIEEEEWRRRYWLENHQGPGLLVWGAVQDGEVRIEPAIALDRARPTPATAAGPVVEGVDEAGSVLFRSPAATMDFAHGAEGSFAFAAVVPLSDGVMDRLVEVRVAGAGVPRTFRRSGVAARGPGGAPGLAQRAPGLATLPVDRGRQDVVWDAERFPLLVVRERDTDTVVAFARTGRFRLPAAADRLRFDLSDGVRSVRARPESR